MKIFVVTADIELTSKPGWLDDFRSRYDKPYPYHITLKQPCFVNDNQVGEIKDRLATLFSKDQASQKINLKFDELKISTDAPGGICIMINSSDDTVHELQKNVVDILSQFTNYYKPEYQTYEKQFQPHITIARDLDSQKLQEASKELEQDYACEGKIGKIILTVVDNFGPEEANDPTNQTIYNLKS
jgi:2'-5' RNA ligase